MPSNLAIDDDLLEKALKVGGRASKRATVNEALEEYIRRRAQLKSLHAIGTFEYDPKYDHKSARRKK